MLFMSSLTNPRSLRPESRPLCLNAGPHGASIPIRNEIKGLFIFCLVCSLTVEKGPRKRPFFVSGRDGGAEERRLRPGAGFRGLRRASPGSAGGQPASGGTEVPAPCAPCGRGDYASAQPQGGGTSVPRSEEPLARTKPPLPQKREERAILPSAEKSGRFFERFPPKPRLSQSSGNKVSLFWFVV